jgi:myo-inositol-1(or 4)-monophosphatase
MIPAGRARRDGKGAPAPPVNLPRAMTEADEDALLAVALEAARGAGAELRARFGHRQHGVRAKSGPTDLVSDADLAAEAAIRDVLRSRRPDDAILAEEGGATAGGALRWVVDPLDGTINFLFGVPAWGVSVACEDADGGLVGVVLDPMRDECFAATRSGRPTLDGEPIRARAEGELANALVATGFSYDAAVRARQAEVITRLLPRVRDIRRMGAAALDLCWAACGRYDAFYERGLKPWDLAAGALIAQRAGLEVRELPEEEDQPGGVAVTRSALMDELLELVLGA